MGVEFHGAEPPPAVSDKSYQRTDLGNAEAFADQHGYRLRCVPGKSPRWLVCESGRWRTDNSGEAARASKNTVRRMYERAFELEEEERAKAAKWALASQSESRIRALLTLAATEPGIALTPDQLDADPWLLACKNGVLDLRSAELRPYNAEDLITRGNEIAYDPDATCPRWLSFLDEVFDGDADLIGFVRRAAGYCLTGDTREHVLFVAHGAGCNGKSTLVETFRALLGELAANAASDSFLRSRNDRSVRNDIARLHRARLVTASESGEAKRLDEAMVKQLTGDDTVTARYLYAEHFEFRPEFKLWLSTNHRPVVDGTDDAIWRRLRLLPFEVSFEGREDKELRPTLEAELPGILAWAVAGCQEWQRHGLGTAGKVEAATREYRVEEDVLGLFLDERCHTENGASTAAVDLRQSYEQFCKELGERPVSARSLGKQMSKRGHTAKRSTGGARVYPGVSLVDAEGLF